MIRHRASLLAVMLFAATLTAGCAEEYFDHLHPLDPEVLDSVRVVAVIDTIPAAGFIAKFSLRSFPFVTGYAETWVSENPAVLSPTDFPGEFTRVGPAPSDTLRIRIWGGYPPRFDTVTVVLLP